MQMERAKLGSALAAMVLLVAGSVFADVPGPTVGSSASSYTRGSSTLEWGGTTHEH